MKVLVLHGPNLNLLGTRQIDIYGQTTLVDINQQIAELAKSLNVQVQTLQSNHEGELVEAIQSVDGEVPPFDGILINAAAYTHTSVAIRDALLSVGTPFVEVHLSNTKSRESFRQQSMLEDVAIGIVQGFGANSYLLGFRGLISYLNSNG